MVADGAVAIITMNVAESCIYQGRSKCVAHSIEINDNIWRTWNCLRFASSVDPLCDLRDGCIRVHIDVNELSVDHLVGSWVSSDKAFVGKCQGNPERQITSTRASTRPDPQGVGFVVCASVGCLDGGTS